MKRLATLVLAAGFSLSSLVVTGMGASATPFSDVPANHWAYQAIQSLAADGLVEGYPDGKFKGDRPLTRYEMAVLVARVIAKVQANGAGYASKADLDKLQKLIDALKDELDSLGVRVTNLEDALDALDKRTKFAQSIALHGTILDNTSWRQQPQRSENLAHGAADPYTNAFLSSPANNSPLEQTGSGNLIRFDDKFNFSYVINENLTVSIPVHILNYEYGGEFTPQAKYSVQPDVVVNIAKAGALTNMYWRFGQLDNMQSSRLGLTYRAPDATQQGPGLENPVQPYEKGFEIGGTLSGLTSFQFAWTRLDQNYINTLTNVPEATQYGDIAQQNYFFMRTPPQQTLIQNGAQPTTFSYTVQGAPATFIYLPNKALAGTVYIVSYNGTTCFTPGAASTPASPYGAYSAACPTYFFADQNNQIVFSRPLPVGSVVSIAYTGLTYGGGQQQRYHINARINQKIKGLPGAEVGLSFSRIFDFADFITSQGTQFYNAAPVNATAGNGYGYVSDTVFGLDFQAPITGINIGTKQHPVIYGEGAYSKYTPDFYNIPAVTDSAAVIGLRLGINQVTASLQYQAVGKNFLSGAPFRYFGPPPATFAQWSNAFFPQFFGFANNLAINSTFDAATGATTHTNAAYTFLYPVYNPFVASGPQFFSAFAPNSQGFTLNVGAPVRLGDLTFNTNLIAQHLYELTTNGYGQLTFNGVPGSNQKLQWDKIGLSATFAVPAFGQKVALNLSADDEHLSRHDNTTYAYVPGCAANGGLPTGQILPDAGVAGCTGGASAAAAAYAAAGGAPVLYYPNYIDEYHVTLGAGASLPVSRDLVFAVNYNTQDYYGSYGTTHGQNIAEIKTMYQGTLTYNIPKTTSSISALYRNQQYKDNVMPTYNFNGNREDLTFTVRF